MNTIIETLVTGDGTFQLNVYQPEGEARQILIIYTDKTGKHDAIYIARYPNGQTWAEDWVRCYREPVSMRNQIIDGDQQLT